MTFISQIYTLFYLLHIKLFYLCLLWPWVTSNRHSRSQRLRVDSTLCLKTVPTFKLSVTLSHLNRFSKILHCWKAHETCYKTLRHVATTPWEIKNSNFCWYSADMEENSSILHSPLTLLFVHKFWYFRCLEMGCLSPYPMQIYFLCHCSFGYLLLRSIRGIENSSQQRSLQCLSTINMVFRDKDKILIKSVFEGVHSKQVDRRISWETLDKAWH